MLEPDDSVDRMTALVAIVRAARLTGHRTLERSARRELSTRFGLKLTFATGFSVAQIEKGK